jgi:hypothetical protein
MTDLDLYLKLAALPDDLKQSAARFVEFLKTQAAEAGKAAPPQRRKAGLAKGLIRMGAGFDEPLEDFNAYMEP